MALCAARPHMNGMDLPELATSRRAALPDRIGGVIFDMDGTLLDSEAAHLDIFAQVGAALGWPLPRELLLSMVGVHRDANRDMLAQRLGPDFPIDRFYADSDSLFEAAVDAGIPAKPGAIALPTRLADAGVPMAVATSTASPFAQERLAKSGIADFFNVVVTRSDVARPKPDPQPYLLAASRLGVSPGQLVAIEDSPIGVRSATLAGIATIMAPDLLPATAIERASCVAIVNELTDVIALLRLG